MKEEEVDRYFKNKFDQFAPVPSADAWARLQSKLEPPRQKRPAMWVYYAAAALTLAFVSGALLFWLSTDSLNSNENLARQEPITTPLLLKPSTEIIADAGIKPPETVAPIKEEKTIKNTNTNNNATSKPVKKAKKIRPGILVAAAKPVLFTNLKKDIPVTEPKLTSETASADMATTAQAQPMPERITEVIIKKDPTVTLASADNLEYQTAEEAIKENISKKGRLVKNIFKQARNLKNGEKVELSTLGLNANYRIDVESKLLKQKYSKVINL